jgi:hypothetical protein
VVSACGGRFVVGFSCLHPVGERFRRFSFYPHPEGVLVLRRAIDSLLLVVVLVGGYLAWQMGRERSHLAEHYRQLVKMAGDMVVTDPTKIHVQALDTGDPLHFAWRVFLPANYPEAWHATRGGTGNRTSAKPTEFIQRVRLRPNDQGKMQIYTRGSFSSSLANQGHEALNDLLRGRWNKLKVERIGGPSTAVIDPSQAVVFLRLTLPEDLADEARSKLPENAQRECFPVVYELSLGQAPPSQTTIWTPSPPLVGAGE